jgi:hypothetical protein
MNCYCIKTFDGSGVHIWYMPGPAAAGEIYDTLPVPPAMVEHSPSVRGHQYYVYCCAPSEEHPVTHWMYFPWTLSKDQLPDIREARPIHTWQLNTGRYSLVTDICLTYECGNGRRFRRRCESDYKGITACIPLCVLGEG